MGKNNRKVWAWISEAMMKEIKMKWQDKQKN